MNSKKRRMVSQLSYWDLFGLRAKPNSNDTDTKLSGSMKSKWRQTTGSSKDKASRMRQPKQIRASIPDAEVSWTVASRNGFATNQLPGLHITWKKWEGFEDKS